MNRVTVNARADTSGASRLTRGQYAGSGAWLYGWRTSSPTGRATAQRPNEQCDVVRERRFEREWPPLRRMLEAEPPCVECLPVEPDVGALAAAHRSQSHVLPLANERVPSESGLDPNLVPFPRVQPYLDECRTRERLNYAIAADRLDAAGIAAMCPLLQQQRSVPGQAITPRALWG